MFRIQMFLVFVAVTIFGALVGSWSLSAEETSVDSASKTATFSMYCYWTGEATLGKVDGVTASRIGHWGGREVVQVDYDPARTDVLRMAETLQRQNALYSVVVDADTKPPKGLGAVDVKQFSGEPDFIEPKHSLRTRYPNIAALDLSESQAIALNTWSYFGGSMPDVLTAEQEEQLRKSE